MEVMFSARFIKITFGVNEEYSGRILRMAGEPLNSGFDADVNSMVWLSPSDLEAVDEKTKNHIKQLIKDRNNTHSFKILFMDGDSYV